jgi:cytochrome b6-f complex iron-sulfur subunit
MRRREFLNKLAIGTTAGAAVVAVAATLTEIIPAETEAYSIIKLGYLDDFPLNQFTFIPDKKIYIYRTRRFLRAISAVCTHLGCTINKAENGFQCPCHGSRFDKTGKALSGPASRPLERFAAAVDKSGQVTVNLQKTVESDLELS